jgi:nucleotide-binding universal stress UspA family protein
MAFTILVPTDFSATAEKAFTYALNIAARSEGTVLLYSAFTPFENLVAGPEETRDEYNEKNEAYVSDSLNALKRKWQAQYATVQIEVGIGTTPLTQSILKIAGDNSVNLIVMGTHGASGLKKLIGSNACHVMSQTVIPLLLVPDEFSWAEPKRIVMATNYQKQDVDALPLISALANAFGASVEVVHLSSTKAQDVPLAREVLTAYVDRLKEKLPDQSISSSVLPGGVVWDDLECLHEVIPYDILVMMRHKMGFLERLFSKSKTQHMACVTHYPLLVIPATE